MNTKGWRKVLADVRLGLGAGSHSMSSTDYELTYGGALLDHIAEKLEELEGTPGPLTLDDDQHVFFYEQDHYYLSNFSSFKVYWRGIIFATSEHAYHWTRFLDESPHRTIILESASAHEAYRFAQEHKAEQVAGWDDRKVDVMRDILRSKVRQHDYVRRKLLSTGDRELIENSWRDPYWGWGPNRDGKNILGRLWMEVRAEIRRSEISMTDRHMTL